MKNKLLTILLIVGVILVLALSFFVKGSKNEKEEEVTDNRSTKVLEVKTQIESCPNCIFTIGEFSFGPSNYAKYYDYDGENYMYSQFYTEGDDYETDYTKVVDSSNKQRNIFMAATLNVDKYVLRGYVCGIKDGKPICLEGTKDGSKYKNNVKLLKKAFKNDSDKCTEALGCLACEKDEMQFLTCKDGYVSLDLGTKGGNCRLIPTKGTATCSKYTDLE